MAFIRNLTYMITVVCLMNPSGLWAAADVDLNKIVEATRQRNRSLQSLYVQYRIVSKVLGMPADAKRYMNIVAEVDETKRYAFKDSKRYYRFERPASSYADIAPEVRLETRRPKLPADVPEAPPPTKRSIQGKRFMSPDLETAFDGSVMRRRERGAERAFVYGNKQVRKEESDLAYFSNEYLWIMFHTVPDVFNTTDSRAEHRLPDALQLQSATVAHGTESVDGHECVVIEIAADARQVLWCDPQLNFAVRRWDHYESGTNHRTWRYELSDFVQIITGFWAPRRCTRLRWATMKAPPQIRAKPLMSYKYQVLEIHANDVPDSLFTLAIPPGTVVVDFINGKTLKSGAMVGITYPMPANAAGLDEVVRNTQKAAQEWESYDASRGVSWGRIAFITGSVVALIVGAVWFYSK